MGNAIEHGAPGQPIEVRLNASDSAAVLEVQSQGAPIPPPLLATLFEPFRSGEARSARSGGLGMGLFISRQVIVAHGGQIDVRSSGEEGTSISVTLPRRPAAGPAPARAAEMTTRPSSHAEERNCCDGKCRRRGRA